MNKNMIGLGIGLLILVLGISMASANKIEKISVGYNTKNLPTDDIRTYIYAENAENIQDIELELIYDPNILSPLNVTDGNLILEKNFKSDIENGKIIIRANSSEGIFGSGNIANILFKIIGNRGETSPLDINIIKVLDMQDNDISNFSIVNSSYTIGISVRGRPVSTAIPTPSTTTFKNNNDSWKGFEVAPTIALTSTKTTVESNSPAILTLSVTNPIGNSRNLLVQPILKVPNGVNVQSTYFVFSGSNPYTGKIIVKPGDSKAMAIEVASQEVGSKEIYAQVIYSPEDDPTDFHQLQYNMNINVVGKATPVPTYIPQYAYPYPYPTPRLSGFEIIIGIMGLLIIYLFRRNI